MCFALPKKIAKIDGSMATMADGSTVRLGTIQANPGEYLLVIGPLAVEKISTKKAQDMLAIVKQLI